jgi:hypothetical protein
MYIQCWRRLYLQMNPFWVPLDFTFPSLLMGPVLTINKRLIPSDWSDPCTLEVNEMLISHYDLSPTIPSTPSARPFPTQPPTTACPREQLPQNDGLARVHQGKTWAWILSLIGAANKLYWKSNFQQWSVEVASAFSPTIRLYKGICIFNSLKQLI